MTCAEVEQTGASSQFYDKFSTFLCVLLSCEPKADGLYPRHRFTVSAPVCCDKLSEYLTIDYSGGISPTY